MRQYRLEFGITLAIAFIAGLRALIAPYWLFGELLYRGPSLMWAMPGMILFCVALWKRNGRQAVGSVLVMASGYILMSGLPVFRQTAPVMDSASDQLVAMTYNVHYSTEGADRVAATIRQSDPDVVFLQEADGPALDQVHRMKLEDALPEYDLIPTGQIAVALKKRSLQFVRMHTVPLQDNLPGRPIQQVWVRKNGKEICLINAHLWPSGFGLIWLKESWMARIQAMMDRPARQVKALADAIPTDVPTIIGMDGNLNPGSRCWTPLRVLATNAFEAAGSGYGYTLPTGLAVQRVDHLWTVGLHVEHCAAVQASGSDHLPVIATCRLLNP